MFLFSCATVKDEKNENKQDNREQTQSGTEGNLDQELQVHLTDIQKLNALDLSENFSLYDNTFGGKKIAEIKTKTDSKTMGYSPELGSELETHGLDGLDIVVNPKYQGLESAIKNYYKAMLQKLPPPSWNKIRADTERWSKSGKNFLAAIKEGLKHSHAYYLAAVVRLNHRRHKYEKPDYSADFEKEYKEDNEGIMMDLRLLEQARKLAITKNDQVILYDDDKLQDLLSRIKRGNFEDPNGDIYRKSQPLWLLHNTLSVLSHACYLAKLYQKSLEYGLEAFRFMYLNIGNETYWTPVYIARAYNKLGNKSEAEKYLNMGYKLYKKYNKTEDSLDITVRLRKFYDLKVDEIGDYLKIKN